MICSVCDVELASWELPAREKFTGLQVRGLCDTCARANQSLPVKTGETHEEAQTRLRVEYPGWPGAPQDAV